MPVIVSTSGRLHSEFIRLLFLQAHRETDRFFTASGVHPAQSTSGGLFHFRCAVFLAQLKGKVGNTLAKAAALRVNLNIEGASITSRAHTHPSHSQTLSNISSINLVSTFRCSSSATNRGHVRRADSSTLVFSLSSHRHSLIGFVFSSRFNNS
jgi:hypothetical protein